MSSLADPDVVSYLELKAEFMRTYEAWAKASHNFDKGWVAYDDLKHLWIQYVKARDRWRLTPPPLFLRQLHRANG